MIAELGTDQKVIDAAKALVGAETNFNPFAVSKPFVCADTTLPTTEVLRGIVPLVDPAVTGFDKENANQKASLSKAFDAAGLSQAQVMIANGFSNFTPKDASGNVVELDDAAGDDAGDGAEDGAGASDDTGNTGDDTGADTGAIQCPTGFILDPALAQDGKGAGYATGGDAGKTGNDDQTVGGGQDTPSGEDSDAGQDQSQGDTGDDADKGGNTNTGSGCNTATPPASTLLPVDTTQSTIPGADFGLCIPTMARLGGLNNRPATEFTFIPQDALVAKGQQEALNPNIITNRICDQLTNVCEANDMAKSVCKNAQAMIEQLNTRDQATADTWNAMLGFAGADSAAKTI